MGSIYRWNRKRCRMVDQKQQHRTFKLANGQEVEAKTLTKEDIEQELAEFEAKYGMTSEEFAGKWKRFELECTHDYITWAMNCKYMARAHGIEELSIPSSGVAEEWKI